MYKLIHNKLYRVNHMGTNWVDVDFEKEYFGDDEPEFELLWLRSAKKYKMPINNINIKDIKF